MLAQRWAAHLQDKECTRGWGHTWGMQPGVTGGLLMACDTGKAWPLWALRTRLNRVSLQTRGGRSPLWHLQCPCCPLPGASRQGWLPRVPSLTRSCPWLLACTCISYFPSGSCSWTRPLSTPPSGPLPGLPHPSRLPFSACAQAVHPLLLLGGIWYPPLPSLSLPHTLASFASSSVSRAPLLSPNIHPSDGSRTDPFRVSTRTSHPLA